MDNGRTTAQETYDLDNVKAQMRKGFLEFPVLLVIGSGKAYASDILHSLRKADLLVVEGTLYPLLSRLKRYGLVSYEWAESKQGPPRKYYTITKEGTEVLRALEQSWTALNTSITTLVTAYEKDN